MLKLDETTLHIRLNFNNKVISVCDDRENCHPDATYWLPTENIDDFNKYLDEYGIEKVNSNSLLAKLLVRRIVVIILRSKQ